MKYLSEYIVEYYIKKNIIDPKMEPIYMHGVSLIINDIINFSAILFIAAIIDSFLNGIIFIATFYLLRVRCGGFHATKEWICRVTMMLTFLSVFTICHLLQYYNIEWNVPIIIIVSSLILIPIIPIDTAEHISQKNLNF